jgi:hypothetical protein
MLSPSYPENNVSFKGKTFEQWADHWYYKIGVNVIPVRTKRKIPSVEWKKWQNDRIRQETFEKWKKDGIFQKGMAIIPGRVWYITEEPSLYFVVIDLDSKLAKEEFCKLMNVYSIEDMSDRFIVEQHKDNLERAHVGFYSEIPFNDKPADDKIGLEIKSNGKGLVNCCPSIHKNGYPYEIIGTLEPIIVTEKEAVKYMEQIDKICKQYGVEYLNKIEKEDGVLDNLDLKINEMINKLHVNLDIKIYKGNRHKKLLSISNKLLFKHSGRYKQDEIKHFLLQINQNCCKPESLPDEEIEQIWFDAVQFVKENRHNSKEENTYLEFEKNKRKNIVDILNDKVIFFKDKRGKKFGRMKVGDHYEILNITQEFFKERISYLVNEEMKYYIEDNNGGGGEAA